MAYGFCISDAPQAPSHGGHRVLTEQIIKLVCRRIVKNLCLCVYITEAEYEEFRVVDAVEFGPERLDFRIY